MDLWITNASIIDGTGAPRFKGDIGVQDGRIVLGGKHPEAKRVIDAKGRIVSPGFIDAHSHGDMILGTESASLFKTNQGVTTEITGQCGQSMAPVHTDRLELVQKLLSIGAPSFPEDMANWSSFGRFMEYGDRTPKTVNMKSLLGHSTLRIAVMGLENRPPVKEELDRMKSQLREAMEAGAAGFSTGLIYTP
jgi:N-acyl-D-amino-acid deacylase